jgi:hypothetical protein
MATVTEVLAQSAQEGSSILLVYDDVTMIGSGIQCSVANTAVGPMAVSISMASGFSGTFTIQPNQFNVVNNIPRNRQPTGVVTTTKFGTQTIDWGITSISMSFD